MEIRPLTPDDAPAYWSLRLEALEDSPRAFSASLESHRERGVAEAAKRIEHVEGHRVVLGAWIEGALVGMVGFVRADGEKTRHSGFAWGVYVTPKARTLGVGTALMRALVERLRGYDGLERMTLEVDADNPAAMRLYEGLGFRSFGLEPNGGKVAGEYVHLHHMVLDLR